MRPALVFATRKFPPSVGGMETLSLQVWRGLAEGRSDVVLVAHGGSNRMLPLWLARAVPTVIWLVLVRRARAVLVGDALLHAVLRPVLRVTSTPDVCLVMGLDVTWPHRLYQLVLRRTLPGADRVLAISRATADAAVAAGAVGSRTSVVRLGVDAPDVTVDDRALSRRELLDQLGLDDDVVLLGTLGRLVRRKGVAWFAEQVLPRLPASLHYVVAGDGPDADAVRLAAGRAGVASRVHLLGSVPSDARERVLRGVDLFVQPNIRVPGDMEGFGLVTIEAALRGTPVLASSVEGIADAVVDGRTGDLREPEDADGWVRAVERLCADRAALAAQGAQRAAQARELYGAEQMARTITDAVRDATRPAGAPLEPEVGR